MTRQKTYGLGLLSKLCLAVLFFAASTQGLDAQNFQGLPAANSKTASAEQALRQLPKSNDLGGPVFAPMKMPKSQGQIKPGALQRLGTPGQLGAGNPAVAKKPADPWRMTARVHLEKGSTNGYLVLQVDLAAGHYIYAVTPKGSPAPTKIQVTKTAEYRLLGQFGPDQQPIVIEKDPLFEQRVEKHKGTVQFFAPIEVHPDLDLAKFNPEIKFIGQVCSEEGFCVPLRDKKVVASFAGFFERTAEGSQSQPQGNPQSQAGGLRR